MMKYLICLFVGMATAFFISFMIETMNSVEPHEAGLLFNAFAWYTSMFFAGVCGLIASRGIRNETIRR
ncbi:hypothetical protein LEP1GSC191_4219 [Leptospira borgpetersenii serovar Mini str. 201000851]|uniref:Uncharacterized protein n=3 Tax=Leptospira borgpetersenii TaxID=174 RepID=M3HI32_LEPBO|nr:hypothetical protein LEP1GSC128_0989 [Leptospira borgpetersenii str. 200801926]EMF97770.1 hypothetical protein LEP1GSC123_0933 [Leptospira borgpetersenii str. 200701203]ENO62885.1 hypothetical protein LEP1GSC191_4219 [Leptospira borgpetersenii serovar Mini str. 201000851]